MCCFRKLFQPEDAEYKHQSNNLGDRQPYQDQDQVFAECMSRRLPLHQLVRFYLSNSELGQLVNIMTGYTLKDEI